MKIAKMLKNLKWIAAWTSTWTMLVSPVAMGQEAQRVSKQQMQQVVDELGLNKQMTIGEFYQKNKYMLPERIKKEIEPFFMANKNMMMPSFEVIASKTTAGDEVPTLRISQNGELLNIQWFGEKNRVMKFQNTNLTDIDVINFNDMFTRIVAGDEKFRKQTEPSRSQYKGAAAKGQSYKYPDVTAANWKSMSLKDRANYIINLRQLYVDAVHVLDQVPVAKSKKKKYSENIFEAHPYFAALFFGGEAQAAEPYFTGKSCLVAGYTSVYGARKKDGTWACIADNVPDLKTDALYAKAAESCKSDQLACNPYIYGAPNGKATCVTIDASDNYQKATHFSGPCDSQSRLQSSPTEVAFLKNDKLEKGRYSSDNLSKTPQELSTLFEADQKANQKLTEDYILGLLKLKGKIGNDVNKIDASLLSDSVLAEIQKIKTEFDSKIKDAVTACKAVADTDAKVEKNFYGACDQLQRRFLFIDTIVAKKCTDQGLTPAPGGVACACPSAPAAPAPSAPAPPAPSAAVAPVPPPAPVAAVAPVPPAAPVLPRPVNPRTDTPPSAPAAAPAPLVGTPTVPAGAANSCPTPPAAVVNTTPPAAAEPALPACSAAPTDNKCKCASGNQPTVDTHGTDGRDSFTCGAAPGDKPGKDVKDKEECGFFCKLWKGVKTIAPFAIAGVAAYFIFKKLAPEKQVKKPAADLCPGSTMPPPCAQTCTPPLKLQSTGACSCDGCPPGQTANSTCTCSTSTTTPTTILCPDSVTRAATLAACPDYPCWNLSSYKNPMNCPTAPAGTSSTINTNQ